MRILAQVSVIAVLGAAGYGGWAYWDHARTSAATGAEGTVAGAGGARRPGGAPALSVDVMPVVKTSVLEMIEAVGTAHSNEAVTITVKESGLVTRLNFTEGQTVAAGHVLAEFDTRERRAEIDIQRAMVDEANRALSRARQLQSRGNVAEARVDELETQARTAEARLKGAEARLDNLRVIAPFAGRVGLRQVSLGALVQPGAVITTLDDTSRLKVEFNVPETLMGRLKPGLAVTARTAAFGAREYIGTVAVVDTRIDAVSRSVRVQSDVPNPDDSLRPGMFMTVELVIGQRANALVVPEQAVILQGERKYVFAVRGGRAIRVPVETGVRRAGQVEIVNGLDTGESVIVTGLQRVRDGQFVQTLPATPRSGAAAVGAAGRSGAS